MPPEALDQASGLRKMLGGIRDGLRTVGVFGPDAKLSAALAANLAEAMALRGEAVHLLDEMPAPGNAAALLGLAPACQLGSLLEGECPREAGMAVSTGGVTVMRAENGLRQLAGLAEPAWARFPRLFPEGGMSWLFMAAPPDGRPSLAFSAAMRLLVVGSQRSHLTEAYALLKAVHQSQPAARWWVVFMNMEEVGRSGQMMDSFAQTARRFLDTELRALGEVPRDSRLAQACKALRSLQDMAPAAPAAIAFRALADNLAQEAEVLPQEHAGDFGPRLGLMARAHTVRQSISPLELGRDRAYG